MYTFVSADKRKSYPKKQSVHLGKDAHIACNLEGPVEWFLNGKELSLPNVYKDGSDLTIRKAIIDNHGIYECTGVTPAGEQFASASQIIVMGEFCISFYF